MAENSQILKALRKLTAYYGKEPTKEKVELYLELLAEVETPALNYAVQTWIKSSPFYPRISELLRTAASYTPPTAPPEKVLLRIQFQLQQDYFSEGKLDPRRWEKLAQDFERHDRIHCAAACRERFRNYQANLTKIQASAQEKA
jgi:hypothetical protein